MDEKQKSFFQEHLALGLIVIGVAAIIFYFLLLKPAIVGYVVADELNELDVSLGEYENTLQAAEERVLAIQEEKELLEENLTSTAIDVGVRNERLAEELSEALKDIQKLENTKENLEEAVSELRDSYDALIDNTAHSICCKARVDDSGIDSYDLLNNKIICVEDGKYDLVC
jgi:DNA repair exonuclease SbcCD ATPase subunit